ncbi:hypothetical protein A2U01_0089007 [Trifolium medium]|uniref:Uncharacterized protein n=1 Tax=Trifolium medium TaxID=97028 RepID=A0A392U3R8_9FABA|nr:hypothetical protein [Trifolium medium]
MLTMARCEYFTFILGLWRVVLSLLS